jgi:hypothetical protein
VVFSRVAWVAVQFSWTKEIRKLQAG